MKRKPLKRKTGLKRTPIRRVSAKLSKELKRYYVLRQEFLVENPMCSVAISKDCSVWASQIHHKLRRGKYLNDTSTWMSLCWRCHEWIEAHGKYARKMGWILT